MQALPRLRQARAAQLSPMPRPSECALSSGPTAAAGMHRHSPHARACACRACDSLLWTALLQSVCVNPTVVRAERCSGVPGRPAP